MVTRRDESWEAVSQRLATPLIAGKCYTFTAYLARSDIYLSAVKGLSAKENFANPVKLRIHGSDALGQAKELLDESPLVAHSEWKKSEKDKELSKYSLFNFDSNVVNVDSKAQITLKHNDRTIPFVYSSSSQTVKADLNLREGDNKVTITAKTQGGTSSESRIIVYNPPPKPVASKEEPVKPFNPKILTKLKDRKSLIVGKSIPIDKLTFAADSSNISRSNYPVMNELVDFLKTNEDISIEIGGHTNDRCEESFCNELSELRAKAVVDYLKNRGVADFRLSYKGYGKTNPKASNKTPTGRRTNQRVEIKVTKIAG